MMAVKLVAGFGINDADYHVAPRIGPVCLFYKRWLCMVQRCYSEKFKEKRPSYSECYVAEEWRKFTNFKSWMMGQDWVGKELDKDLLVPGNKCYSPNTCVFVPARVNTLFSHRAGNPNLPIGVCYRKTWVKKGTIEVRDRPGMRYEANCSGSYLGKFETPKEAHVAWQIQKVSDIHSSIERFPDLDLRVVRSLLDRAEEISRDIDQGIETILE